jgi:predicted O-linked N-acetylglucosamine transferase (SPINDLY family)
LRVGYVSADFRQHSVAFFIEPVIEAHDRRGFEVICYSNVAWPDAVTMRMRKLADQWRDIARRCDEDVAEQIRRDGVDILVDLAGHTDGNRLLVFARKPAPVQVTYLGYPDTTGLRTMDYRLTDAYADPPGETEPYHSEELVRLARCFLCYRPATESPEVGELPALAAGTVTFGSFNSFAKVTEEVMGAWSRILLAVPESRLVLKAKGLGQAEARERAGEVFERHGIAPQRVEMTGQSESFVEHLRAYQCVDIALDTFPYNGTTTTCEALWMGVPVITLAGRSHVWRVGMSLLSNAGLPELIAATLDDYVAAAARLAGDVDGLRQMRRGLRQRLGASALTDAAGFTRRLEEAYRGIWANWCAGRQ